MNDAKLPMPVQVVERIAEGRDIFTLRLRLVDEQARRDYRFAPGQFNMLYLHGVGEVAISIVSDRDDPHLLDHTIRVVGRATRALARVGEGEHLGIRGPFGRGWPVRQALGRDLLVVTGGLGCAPAVSVIRHVLKRRADYGRLTIMQGVKHSDDLIWRDQYQAWAQQADTRVLLAADIAGPGWQWRQGMVTSLFDQVELDPDNSIAMMCGPEPMMIACGRRLMELGLQAGDIHLSMERNMHCGVGHCGHCQIGPKFVCRDGPVFAWPELQPLLGQAGY